MTLLELSSIVEGLEGPDREVDAKIQRALGDGSDDHWFADMNGDWVTDDKAPHYTGSLDAAMTLVPKGALWQLSGIGEGAAAIVVTDEDGDPLTAERQLTSTAATPALALCAAALRAQAESMP